MKPKSLGRWKLRPRETGLRAIAANPYRSSELRTHDGQTIASVSPLGGSWNSGPLRGWYFVVFGDGLPYQNTCNDPPYPSDKEAKAAAEAYIREVAP